MLNRSGKRSKRNLDKPWRPISTTVKNGVEVERPMETIKIYRANRDTGEAEEGRMIFNGTIGSLSIDGRGGGHHVLKVGTKSTPGKCFGRKKKSPGGLVHRIGEHEDIRIEQLRVKRKLNRWHKLFNYMVLGFAKTKKGKRKLTYEEHLEYQSLKVFLRNALGEKRWSQEYERALRRRESLLGMLDKGQI